jgi:hypothetical protein
MTSGRKRLRILLSLAVAELIGSFLNNKHK